jgi:hypothetical protein
MRGRAGWTSDALPKPPDDTTWMSRMALAVMEMPWTQSVWWTRSSPLKRNRKTSPGRIGGRPSRMRR